MQPEFVHTTAIVMHATAGIVAFISGSVLLFRIAHRGNERWFEAYQAGLVGLIVFMAAAMATHWLRLTAARQLTYLGLSALALYMVFRGWSVRRAWQTRTSAWQSRFVDDIGFTLISLFNGFAIVTAIDLRAPGWFVAIVAVGAVLSGIAVSQRIKRRVLA